MAAKDFKINIDVAGNSGVALQGLRTEALNVVAAIDNLRARVTGLSDVFKKIDSSSLKTAGSSVSSFSKALNALDSTKVDALSKALHNVFKGINPASFKDVSAGLSGISKASTQLSPSKADSFATALKKIGDAGNNLNHDKFTQLATALEKIRANATGASASVSGLARATNSIRVPNQLPRELDGLRFGFMGLGQASNLFGLGMSTNISSAISMFGLLGPAGTAAGAAITAAFAGIKESIEVFSNFEKAIKDVEIVSGASAATLSAFETEVRRVAIESKFTATEVAGAASELVKAGLSADAAKVALQGVADFAAAGDIAPDKAAGMMVEVAAAYQYTAEKFKSIGDQILTTANITTASVDSLSAGLKYVVPIAATAGYSFSRIAADLGSMHNAGLRGTKAATSLRQVMSLLVAPTKQVSALIVEMNARLSESGQALYSVNDEFGNFTGFDELSRAMNQAGISVSEMMRAFRKEGGTAAAALKNIGAEALLTNQIIVALSDNAATKMKNMRVDTISGQWAIFKSNIEEVGIAFGKTVRDDIVVSLKQSSEAVIKNRDGFVWLMDIVYKVSAIFIKLGGIIGGVVANILKFFATAETGQFLIRHLTTISDILSKVLASISSGDADFKKVTESTRSWLTPLGFVMNLINSLFVGADKLLSAFGSISEFLFKLAGYKSSSSMPGGSEDIAKAAAYEKSLTAAKKRLADLQSEQSKATVGSPEYKILQSEVLKAQQTVEALTKEQTKFVSETRKAADAANEVQKSLSAATRQTDSQKAAEYVNSFSALVGILETEEEQAAKLGKTYSRNNEVVEKIKETLKALGLEGQFDPATVSAKDLLNVLKFVDEAYQKFLNSSHAVYDQAQKNALIDAFSAKGSVNTDQATKALRDYAETQRQTTEAAIEAYIKRQVLFGQQITIEGMLDAEQKARLSTEKELTEGVDKSSEAWKRSEASIKKAAETIAQHQMASNKLVASQSALKTAVDAIGGPTKASYEMMKQLSQKSIEAGAAQEVFASKLKLAEEQLSANKNPLQAIITAADKMKTAFQEAFKATASAMNAVNEAILKSDEAQVKNSTNAQQLREAVQQAVEDSKRASADRMKVAEEEYTRSVQLAAQQRADVLASATSGAAERVAALLQEQAEKAKANAIYLEKVAADERANVATLQQITGARGVAENAAREISRDKYKAIAQETSSDLNVIRGQIADFMSQAAAFKAAGDTAGAAAAKQNADMLRPSVVSAEANLGKYKELMNEKQLAVDADHVKTKEQHRQEDLESRQHLENVREVLVAQDKLVKEAENSPAYKGVIGAQSEAKGSLSYLEKQVQITKETKENIDATAASLTTLISGLQSANRETQLAIYAALGDTTMLQYLEEAKNMLLQTKASLKSGDDTGLSKSQESLRQLLAKISERTAKVANLADINAAANEAAKEGAPVTFKSEAAPIKNVPETKKDGQAKVDAAGPITSQMETKAPTDANVADQKQKLEEKLPTDLTVPLTVAAQEIDAKSLYKSADEINAKLVNIGDGAASHIDAVGEKTKGSIEALQELRSEYVRQLQNIKPENLSIKTPDGVETNKGQFGAQQEKIRLLDVELARLKEIEAAEAARKTQDETNNAIAAAEAARTAQDLAIKRQTSEDGQQKAEAALAAARAAEKQLLEQKAILETTQQEIVALKQQEQIASSIAALAAASANNGGAQKPTEQLFPNLDNAVREFFSTPLDFDKFFDSVDEAFSQKMGAAVAPENEVFAVLTGSLSEALVSGTTSDRVTSALSSLKAIISELFPSGDALSGLIQRIQETLENTRFSVNVVGNVSVSQDGGGYFAGGIIGDNLPRFATGGIATGPGGIDNIVARVTRGEGIIRQASMKKLGRDTFNFINKTGTLPKTADQTTRTTIELAGRSGLALEGNPMQVKKIVEMLLKEMRK